MAVTILGGKGGGYEAGVTSGNRLMVDLGGDIIISGVSIDSVVIQETGPTDDTKNNPENQFIYITSGTSTGITGSEIGSQIQYIGAGSFIRTFSYTDNQLVNVGSWV